MREHVRRVVGARTTIGRRLPSPLCTKGATATRRKQMIAARKVTRVCTRACGRRRGLLRLPARADHRRAERIELHPVLGFTCLSKGGSHLRLRRPLARKCAASYPDECILPPPPDLNCADIPYRNFRVLWNGPTQTLTTSTVTADGHRLSDLVSER